MAFVGSGPFGSGLGWLVLFAGMSVCADAFAAAGRESADVAAPATATELLDRAYRSKAEGRNDEAAKAFVAARDAGASAQLVAIELAYLAAARGAAEEARALFSSAADVADGDPELRARARAELDAMAKPAAKPVASPADEALAEGYRLKAERSFDDAAAAFSRAKAAGADSQRVSMELALILIAQDRRDDVSRYFNEAAGGPDAELADRARAEMKLLPKHVWGDAYAEAFGWQRAAGESQGGSLVPTARVRGMVRPSLSLDLNLYVYAQATRDTASHGFVGTSLPRIYADDYALLGSGVLLRLWGGRIGLFAQIGPAFDLLDDGRSRMALDARGGATLFAETSRCAPPPAHGAWVGFAPCLEAYAEAIYVSRFDNNVFGFARPRAAGSYLVTGPVAWQAVVEARAAVDRNHDYYNDFADAGAGHRWRLLAPFRIDAMVSANVGTYFGVSNRDPAPSRLGYADLRLGLSTYAEF